MHVKSILALWIGLVAVLLLALPALAGAPVEIQAQPGGDAIPRCIVEGEGQGAELSSMRTACDVLAFLNGFSLGVIRPCGAGDASCEADSNGDTCLADEKLWLCFGVGG
jgi:hypothetical protein